MRDDAALRRLAELYARAVDRRDADLFLSLFADDAELQSHIATWRGKEQLGQIPPRMRTRYDKTLHTVMNQQVAIDGDNARGETYCIAYHLFPPKDGKQQRLDMYIRYQDRFVRQDGAWKFARRQLDVQWTETKEHPIA